jgi:hypothetical protein
MAAPTVTLEEINRRNRKFWKEQQAPMERRMADEAIREIAFETIRSETTGVLGCQSPHHYVANHPITTELKKRGATDDQLAAIRFRGKDRGTFDQWSFTWGSGMPLEALPLVTAYCALKWLILEDPPSSKDKEDAWRYLNDTMIAPVVALGLKHKQTQRRRAQRPRGKVTDDGRTLKQIVEALVLRPDHREESAWELWPHFSAELDQLGLDPKEIEHSDRRKIRYEYRCCDRLGKITYGQFANLVSKVKNRASG